MGSNRNQNNICLYQQEIDYDNSSNNKSELRNKRARKKKEKQYL